jgi:hypothetical protein
LPLYHLHAIALRVTPAGRHHPKNMPQVPISSHLIETKYVTSNRPSKTKDLRIFDMQQFPKQRSYVAVFFYPAMTLVVPQSINQYNPVILSETYFSGVEWTCF